MPEHPIIFSGEMICAILDGRKTQTRRVCVKLYNGSWCIDPDDSDEEKRKLIECCPYGQPGDMLWVRETWGFDFFKRNGSSPPEYKADWYGDEPPSSIKWKPSIHMPRKYSRITLEVVKVRVERVQDISWEDAVAEGIPHTFPEVDRGDYSKLWDSINSHRGFPWSSNPWVWCISFKVITR